MGALWSFVGFMGLVSLVGLQGFGVLSALGGLRALGGCRALVFGARGLVILLCLGGFVFLCCCGIFFGGESVEVLLCWSSSGVGDLGLVLAVSRILGVHENFTLGLPSPGFVISDLSAMVGPLGWGVRAPYNWGKKPQGSK